MASIFRKAGLAMDAVGGISNSTKTRSRPTAAAWCSSARYWRGRQGPHLLCAYLYDVAGLFSSFYEHCPILSIEDDGLKQSRLKLAALTARMKQDVELLGLTPLERM